MCRCQKERYCARDKYEQKASYVLHTAAYHITIYNTTLYYSCRQKLRDCYQQQRGTVAVDAPHFLFPNTGSIPSTVVFFDRTNPLRLDHLCDCNRLPPHTTLEKNHALRKCDRDTPYKMNYYFFQPVKEGPQLDKRKIALCMKFHLSLLE